MGHLEWLKEQNPSITQRMQEIESFTQNYVASPQAENRILVTIPVVVHVLLQYFGSEHF
jgi:hypothetical protein